MRAMVPFIVAIAPLAFTAPAGAQDEPGDFELADGQILVDVKQPDIVWRAFVIIEGRVGGPHFGDTVVIEQDPYPFGKFVSLLGGQTQVEGSGRFRLATQPVVNTRYRLRLIKRSTRVSTSKPFTVYVNPYTEVGIRGTARGG